MSLDKEREKDPPLSTRADLTDYFRQAEKPAEQFRIGLEHEKLLVDRDTGAPIPYEGPRGIGALLERLQRHGYTAYREAPDKPVIALERGKETISLEPGGQLELSGSPLRTARDAHAENVKHLAELRAAAAALNMRIVALGYRPYGELATMPWMPKSRYSVMRETLGTRGKLAFDMMLMTATGQVSLDWSSEEDAVKKATAAARVAPLLVALYANSPLAQGKRTGYASYRSRVWSDVDPARTGYVRTMVEGGFSYDAYVDWALQAPMLFLRRDGGYLNPRKTFQQYMETGFEGHVATHGDWADHLSTLFPEVRLKKVLEIRSADCAGPALTASLVALYRSILYDAQALEETLALMPKLKLEQHLAIHEAARRDGLRGVVEGFKLADRARELLAIARRGLERLDPLDLPALVPLESLARTGRSLSDMVLLASDRGPNFVLQSAEL